MKARLLLAFAAALPGAGCFQERLDVLVTTRIHPDGRCERRIEYRLEHSDPDKSGARVRVPIDPDEDGLRRFHRFPPGEPWRVRDESGPESHVVVAEAFLPSPNDVGSDYSRALSPRAPAAGTDAAQEAVKESLDALFDRFTKENPGAEEALDFGSGSAKKRRVHFKFTLVMPGPILRANTCFSGDTATWEFDDDDLYVHGFDLRARASASPP